MISISGLYIYPVKSCRGISLDEAEVGPTGFVHDRQWLVVDRHGTFMTQRDWPALARVTAAISADGLRRITVGGVGFRVVKPCARCVITTIDQTRGARGQEPLRTLATYRRVGGEVLFGQNLIHDGGGTVRIGDECVVTD